MNFVTIHAKNAKMDIQIHTAHLVAQIPKENQGKFIEFLKILNKFYNNKDFWKKDNVFYGIIALLENMEIQQVSNALLVH